MSVVANPERGEAQLLDWTLRPTFSALVAAEEELGPLFALVERAASGRLGLAEMAALFWHCLDSRDGLDRDSFGEALAKAGMARITPALRSLLGQILAGR